MTAPALVRPATLDEAVRVLDALAHASPAAVGKPFNRLPITPFDVLAALRER